jgi:hypothetical protein
VTAGSSFHLKAYIFARLSNSELVEGTAFVGSSNISRQALQEGLEWNYRVVYPADHGFLEARTRFEEIFSHSRTVALSDAWIESYEKRRVPPPRSVAPGSHEQEPPPEPTEIQQAALASLHETRQQGFRRGVVVLATGLGKTWLAAFDAAQVNARRVLFVAHREEILAQAAATFVRIRPRARVGYYMGRSRDAEVDVLCASVQTLGRAEHLERFSAQHFDYVVIDEFHHAAAATYRRLLGHFAPAFLLGLTATPDRTDQSDILSLCDDNLVFTRNLFEGIQAKLLSPFHYHGILDESVDYREVPWRNGRFDPEELSNKLATLARAPKGGDTDQIRAVAAGECAIALTNTYYLARLMRSTLPEAQAIVARLGVMFPNQADRGTHVNIAGGAVARHAKNVPAAVRFLEYLASPAAQAHFADGNNESPIVSGVAFDNPALKAMTGGSFKAESLPAHRVGMNQVKVQQMLDRVGFK